MDAELTNCLVAMTVRYSSPIQIAGHSPSCSKSPARQFLSTTALAAIALHNPLRALADTASVTVSTPSGPLRGEQAGGVNIFRGVPFASHRSGRSASARPNR